MIGNGRIVYKGLDDLRINVGLDHPNDVKNARRKLEPSKINWWHWSLRSCWHLVQRAFRGC
jgi:hypothetical protein